MDEQELESYTWQMTEEDAGDRIDRVIAARLGDRASRSQVQQWIKDGAVSVQDESVKSNYKLALGDIVTLHVPEPDEIDAVPEHIPLDIAYEDHDVIVVNKPRGMVVHPSYGHPRGTLVNALLHHCKDLSGIGGVMRPGIVHRIDKDTSGLIMAAKNDQAHASLSAQLKEHTVVRKYMAIVHGVLPHKEGTVDAPIGRSMEDRKLYRVTDKNAKHAVTHFVVAEQFDDYALMQLQLETGRTHQIRVHMKFIGHPLVGDPVYGRSKGLKMDGQALHAAVLGFKHPVTGEYMEFQADMPEDMQQLLHILRTG